MEAGLIAMPDSAEDVIGRLTSLLDSDYYADAARSFAARYRDYDPQAQVERIVNRIEELLTKPRC